jgi:hypothetical protein
MLSAFIPLWGAILVGVMLLLTALLINKRVFKEFRERNSVR